MRFEMRMSKEEIEVRELIESLKNTLTDIPYDFEYDEDDDSDDEEYYD